ncbi:hypothetical protein IPZ68_39310, partial [Streptomyces arenae]|nr:hypothetical protein [Streptomyces arenae]
MALRRMLAQGRLVTVVGGAGVGKSLLAEHAAAAVGGSLPDGVVRVRWWDGGPPRRRSVAQAVADAMDGTADGESGGSGPSVGGAELVARLRARRMLLVLDDFDPVRGECVRLVRALLEEAPEVRVLAAGRHPLGLGDEAVLRLGPLAVGVGGSGGTGGGEDGGADGGADASRTAGADTSTGTGTAPGATAAARPPGPGITADTGTDTGTGTVPDTGPDSGRAPTPNPDPDPASGPGSGS